MKQAITVHAFESTGRAYDACQCDENVRNGDILLIPSEGVVGLADTWPVAVTELSGYLHAPASGILLSSCMEGRCLPECVIEAKRIAAGFGYPIRK